MDKFLQKYKRTTTVPTPPPLPAVVEGKEDTEIKKANAKQPSPKKNPVVVDPPTTTKQPSPKKAKTVASPTKPLKTPTITKSSPKAFPPTTTTTTTTSTSSSSSLPITYSAPLAAGKETQLWADKYAPQTFEDLVGAPTLVKNLTTWLRDWDDVHLHKRKVVAYEASNPGARAAMLSGPPGIGKTTTAKLVAKACSREIMELNASDTRNKKMLHEALTDVVHNRVLSFATTSTSSKSPPRRRVIVMDEVDGMSGSDRGGMQELVNIIKTTQTPIICICNDLSKPAVRTLQKYCYDLKFIRPQNQSIAKRMQQVAKAEGLVVDEEAMQNLITSSGNDVRQVLNALQMWASSSHEMKNADAKERSGAIQKDAIHRLTSFDACRFLFGESHKAPMSKLIDAFFVDYDLIPLMVAQNYIAAVNNVAPKEDDLIKLQRLTRAADAVCDGDVVSKQIRGTDMRWDLLSNYAALNLRVAYVGKGSIGFPGFPEWMGKNSNRNKRHRLLQELTLHSRHRASATTNSLRLDYLPYLRDAMVIPLARNDPDAVDRTIDLLDEYGFSREDLFDGMRDLQFPETSEFPDQFNKLTPQVKSSFTREYNKRAHTSQALVAEQGAPSKKRKRGGGGEDDEDGGDEGDDENGDDEEVEEEDVEAIQKAFAAKGSKGTASASTSASKTPKPSTSSMSKTASSSGKKSSGAAASGKKSKGGG